MKKTNPPSATDTPAKTKHPHCLYLLVGLVILMLIAPAIDGSESIDGLGTIAAGVVLLGGILAVRTSRRELVVAIMLGVLAVVISGAQATLELKAKYLVAAAHGTSMLFFGYIMIAVLCYVMQRGKVTADKLFGAACVYLLIGLTWASLFGLMKAINPNAFTAYGPDQSIRWSDMIYYSYSTLTTVGYGDIAATQPEARMLSVLEAICGVLYTAVLVARLVALYQIDANSEKTEPEK